MAPISDVLAKSVAAPRFRAALPSAFSRLALLLAALGIYGAIAHSVARRICEIGVRMASGASPASMLLSAVARAAKLACVGIAAGFLGAIAFMRALTSVLFGVQTLDMSVLIAASAVLVVVSVLAALIPAARAAGIDSVRTLRHE